MDFKQKAEEKKMSMSKNIARLAVTAGLTAALSFGGVMAPVTMAFAADAAAVPANSITIKQDAKNTDAADTSKKTQFVAYQIFNAKVVDGADAKDKVVSDVAWATNITEPTQTSIINAIEKSARYDSSKSKLPEDKTPSAQDVADWMAANLQDASWVVNNGDLLDTIADLVKGTTPVTPEGADNAGFAADGQVSFKNSGYYLFLTDDGSIGTEIDYSNKRQTGTSPIFAVVGGSAVEVTEKTGIPTVIKKIRDDKPDSTWKDKADSQMDQPVQYQLTGTVAHNVATFDTYYYEFQDELSAGLTANLDSVEVKIGDVSVSKNTAVGAATGYDAAIDSATNTLTVKFVDLKAAAEHAGATLNENSKVVVTYTAKLDPAKKQQVVIGGAGNENSVKLIYSNNPMSDGKGESVPDTVRDYTYALKLVKEDSGIDATKLKGVKFTIQATGADENTSTKYVQENGSLGDDAYEFTTDDNGEINIKGLDAGTYTVEETHALDEYNTLPKFTFTITADGLGKDEGDNTLTVTTTKKGSDLVIDPIFDEGTVNLTVKNKKGSGLPLTGLNGVTFTWIAGGAVLCIGVAHLIRSRKQAEESEQE